MKKHLLSMCMVVLACVYCHAQVNKSEDDDLTKDFDSFTKDINSEFDEFKSTIDKEFVEFVSNPWKEFKAEAPLEKPKDIPVKPVVKNPQDNTVPEDHPVIVKDVIKTQPQDSQPNPVEPVRNLPIQSEPTIAIDYFGTGVNIRYNTNLNVSLEGVSERSVAAAVKRMMKNEDSSNLLYDCLSARDKMNLSDWGYLVLLKDVSDKIYGKGTNESALFLAYLFMKSGYKARFASDGNKLYTLFASANTIYGKSFFTMDGQQYFPVENRIPNAVYICEAKFPGEKALSLQLLKQPLLTEKMSQVRTIKADKYPDVSFSFSTNKNLLDFYTSYPSSCYNDNMMTRWAQYADTPASKEMKEQVYPALQSELQGKSQLEQVNCLLNLIQYGLKYEYDDKVWGGDRAFFPDETLYYPYCDCEDRAILLSRWVRDIIGLDCVLVFYPGHLAMAVEFSQPVKGDYISLNGHRYTVCDPTYIGVSAGTTMSGMDNSSAQVILLNK